ncbi:MAG TPA: AI-2E family transporter, partial [Planctomycetota bacterium]|nr:AI-2E family transporter [Planctomycetota bacterium]
ADPLPEGAPDGDRDAGRDLDPFSPSNTELSESFGGWQSIVATVEQRLGELSLPDELVGYVVRELEELNRNKEALTLGLLGGGVEVLRSVLLVLLYMLFIFAEQAIFRRKILAIAGDRREQAQEMLDTIGRGIQRFLGLKTLVSFATGALCYAALVALEIPYALLFGFLTFALNFIPYFGSIVAGVLPTVTAFAIGATWNTVIIIVVVYIAVNFLIGNIMEPRVMGRELDLSPLVILVSVVVWGSLWGLVGAFLAVPLTATLQIILASSDATRPVALMLSSGPPRGSGRGLRPG